MCVVRAFTYAYYGKLSPCSKRNDDGPGGRLECLCNIIHIINLFAHMCASIITHHDLNIGIPNTDGTYIHAMIQEAVLVFRGACHYSAKGQNNTENVIGSINKTIILVKVVPLISKVGSQN